MMIGSFGSSFGGMGGGGPLGTSLGSSFGLSASPFKQYQSSTSGGRGRAFTTCGSDYYVAPEVIHGKGYGQEVDLWSIGVILYILLCGFPPFNSDVEGGMGTMYRRVVDGAFSFPSPYWDKISDDAKDLIRGLLQKDPLRRLTAEQASKHRWIQGGSAAAISREPLEHMPQKFREFNQQRHA